MKDWTARNLHLFAAFALVAVALYLYGLVVDQFALRLATKAFPVVGLMALVAAKGRGSYSKTILVGLGLCLAGDLLLEFRQRFFLFGMIAFAAGHIAYIVAFVRRSRQAALVAAIPFLAWIGWALMMLTPGLGKMQVPVTVYTFVIFAMMWRATAVVGQAPSRWAYAAMVGACFFGFSDTLIALDRFHEPIPGVRIPIILTYWTAQALIALSTLDNDATPHAA